MLELIILTILVSIMFVVAIWYASYRSKRRSKIVELENESFDYLPEQPEHEFGSLLQEQMLDRENELQTENERLDSEPNVTLSQAAIANNDQHKTESIQRSEGVSIVIDDEEPVINVTLDKEVTIENEVSIEQVVTSENSNEQTVIAVSVIAKMDQGFKGSEIKSLLDGLSLSYGEMAIFHKLSDHNQQTIYSVADIMKPGTLELSSLLERQVKGLVFFMSLPSPVNGLTVFDDMLNTARTIADKLNGDLCNEQRQLLSEADIEQLRSQIFNFETSRQTNPNQFEI